jgi:hypothetical protein
MPGFLAGEVFLLGLDKRIQPAEIIYPERSRIALINSTLLCITAYDSRSITSPVYSSALDYDHRILSFDAVARIKSTQAGIHGNISKPRPIAYAMHFAARNFDFYLHAEIQYLV